MSYGSAYDWDHVKVRYLADSLHASILDAYTFLGHTPTLPIPVAATAADLIAWRQSNGLTCLVVDFLDHDEALNGLDEFPLGYYPTKTQGDRAFIELLLRSKHFLSHYGFKGTHRTTTVMTMDEIFQKVVVKESRTGRVSRQRFATVAEDLLIDVPSSWSLSYDDDPEEYQDGENDVFQEDMPLDPTSLPLPPPTDLPTSGQLRVFSSNAHGGARYNYPKLCKEILDRLIDICMCVDVRLPPG